MRAAWLALVLCACPTRQVFSTLIVRPTAPAGVTVFHDVRVFTGLTSEALEHQDVVVRGAVIESIAPTGGVLPAATTIEGAGRTLLPGYVDFHVHLTGSAAPPWRLAWPDADHNGQALLASGVTSAQDVGGDLDELKALTVRAHDGTWLGPDFTYAGPIITAKDSYPASMVRSMLPWPASRIAEGRFAEQIETAEQGQRAVDVRVAGGAHHIKVAIAQVPLDAPVYTPELLAAVASAAHAKGVEIVAHADSAEHAMTAVRAGVDALMHGVHLGALSAAQAAELKARNVVVAPTLVVWDRIEQLAELRFAPTEQERALEPADSLAAFSPEVARQQHLVPSLMDFIHQLQHDKPQRLEAVKRLVEAGVTIAVGSDASGSIGCLPGGAFLDEMRLLHEAGVPNADILLGATAVPAHFMAGPNATFGTIEPGKRADLVLLDGNPLEDITATSRIAQVMQRGVVLERRLAHPKATGQ
jgi:imidazolonepropionase-like amidohydrolase